MTQQDAGRVLDPWHGQYAERTAGLAVSEVRALFAVASRPEVVSLAGGMPYVQALPGELVESAFRTMMREHGSEALQYGGGQGIPQIREQILQLMALAGITDASADDVVTTTGSQHALELMAKLFLDPGDVVLAESPSYVGALGTFRSYQAQVVHLAMDAEGVEPTALRETVRRLRADGRRVKFLYTVPNFNNPSGVTMSAARRVEVLEICRSEGLLILEDDPYGLLFFEEPAPPAIRSLDAEHVVYLGSFSKILSPGVRVGWALAPHAIREKLVLAVESSILSPSTFTQWVVTEYFRQSDWREQIDGYRGVYRERRDAMLQALDEHLPRLSWTRPGGGFFVWLRLPESLDSKRMLPRAVAELVAYTPGTAFFADGQGRDRMRLSFCFPTPERIRTGVRRLAKVVGEQLDLLETFGPEALGPVDEAGVSTPPPNLD
ncbi:MAG: PLP-dependent aminotransferase family protein [Pseudoclavibacter sp.]|nr:PLP-dependent aminotransferase family protein [Pseudoclavibacter sp.]